jgi:uncharacterized damage-inducible protein DinB
MQAFAASFRFTNFIMNLVTSDVTEQDAKRRARDGEGASISWIVGHLLFYRFQIMKLLGTEVTNPLGDAIGDHATDGGEYPPLADIVAAWKQAADELEKVIAGVGDKVLLAKHGDGGPHGEKKVMDAISFYVWHESYHMGQLGTLRTQFGYKQTSDVATEASKASA